MVDDIEHAPMMPEFEPEPNETVIVVDAETQRITIGADDAEARIEALRHRLRERSSTRSTRTPRRWRRTVAAAASCRSTTDPALAEPHGTVGPWHLRRTMTWRRFAFLLGTWRGEGTGGFPTIDDFAYREEILFEHVGDPFLLYRQESWDLTTGAPVHFERGFLRPGEHAGDLELCLAHPIGVTEVAHGRLDGHDLTFKARGTTSCARRPDWTCASSSAAIRSTATS